MGSKFRSLEFDQQLIFLIDCQYATSVEVAADRMQDDYLFPHIQL
jgi:phage gp46-like protein